eukprot:TRINITY_DN4272_c0_g2_i12.p1 TRINITY_DN4272_c0_g2~~TRINITY_DN4272_c0_g2_i12.p1  ORF type:complete len:454 (+),score=49.55 TRINITY_DN4272_c0_g2_i12:139-1500(+)
MFASMHLFIIFAACTEALKVSPHTPDVPVAHLAFLQRLYDKVSKIQDGVYNFWITYGPDEEFGGFYNTVDKFGEPILDGSNLLAVKNIIMQSRHLYCASKLYMTGRYPKRDTQKIIDLMNSQYQWIINHFITYKPEPVYQVSRDGKIVIDGTSEMYYTDFFIYSMSYYSMAIRSMNSTRADKALQYAKSAYDSVHKRLYDENFGGYDQAKERNFFFSYGQTARGQDFSKGNKGFNAHMHMLEALTALYKASSDEYIYERLKELLEIYMNNILKGYNFHPLVMYSNWTALSNVDNTYGHDIETCHLIQDAGETIDYASASKADLDAKAIEIAEQVQFYGYDRVNGGLFYGGVIGLGPFQYRKEFWEQAEATLGFWRAYYVSGDISFLETIDGVLDFYNQFMLVEEVGEFYNSLYLYCVDCSVSPNLYNLWKAAYHNMRNFLTFLDEVEIFLQES